MEALKFQPEDSNFYNELRSEVQVYFTERKISMRANRRMRIKIAFMFIVYCLAYASIFIYGNNRVYLMIVYCFMGGWSVLLGLNIGHDAAHNAIFEKREHNRLLLLIFELLGMNGYNWKNRHLGAHHIYPNVMNYDSDIQQTNIVKIFPNDKHRRAHAFQHLYMPFLYLLYIFRWIIYRDFKDVFSRNIGYFDNSKYPNNEIVKMIISKTFYLFYMIGIPFLILNISFFTMLTVFFALTVFGSLVIAMVLLSTHVGEDANFPETDGNGVLPHSWSYHQVLTAADFGTDSHVLNYLFGGFNHHVIHHLFPNICHIHYPYLTPILIRTARKYGFPYRSKKYLITAMFSHFKLLRQNGLQRSWANLEL